MGWDGPLTHRQYLVWQTWLAGEWNKPSRTDHYLMQIAFYILRSNVTTPKRVLMEDQKIEFIIGNKPKKTTNPKTIAAAAKATWMARMTIPPVVVEKGPSDG